eukprot:TRINITY_DN10391_c0_g1_i1.p1 TRINITY_DN10391_c0_g1~~TRINITY_DN10391_c0_g1_i1.p1  ORF type:complete len:256 (+),score=47.03 TRINITY_DN10391_c0_g1_i1:57-824(+)
MGKVHMAMSRAGKVKNLTPHVNKKANHSKKKPTGRAKYRNKKSHETKQNIYSNQLDCLESKIHKEENEGEDSDNEGEDKSSWFISKSGSAFPLCLIDEVPSAEMMNKFTKAHIIDILKFEDQLRKSDTIQERYTKALDMLDEKDDDKYKRSVYDLLSDIDQDIILQSLIHFGYDPKNDSSLNAYRITTGKYLEDPEVKECVIWMKYDKMKMCGDVDLDQPLRDVSLYDVNSSSIVKLSDYSPDKKPLVVVAGSYT